MTPLRSRRLPQLTSKPSCAYCPLGVDAASTISVGAAFRCLQVGRRGEWSGSTGWGGQAVRTGGAGSAGVGAMPWPGRAHWGMREGCTFLGRFAPRAPIFPGRVFQRCKFAQTSARIPPTPRPQMPNRTKNRQICAPAPGFPSSHHPKHTICRFSVPPHQIAPTGQSAPVPPPRHRSPPRLTATAEQSASYRLSGNSTVTRHPSPSLRTLTVP